MAIERIVPDTKEWNAYYANHILRYQFAAQNLKDGSIKNILDAACGVGYGSKYLAQELSCASITAIDKSTDALSIAKSKFIADNIKFLMDDCDTLNNAAMYAPFDVIVSFETLASK